MQMFGALSTINSGVGIEDEHVLTLLDNADALSACGLMPPGVGPIAAQLERADLACIIQDIGVEEFVGMFFARNGGDGQLNIMALAPLFNALETCDVTLDLTGIF